MKSWQKWGMIGGGVLLAALAGYWFGAQGSSSQSQAGKAQNAGPVVPVKTAALKRRKIVKTITEYGRVVAQPGNTQAVSLPYEVTVEHVLVTQGAPVKAGTPLIAVKASPSAQLNLKQAKEAYNAAAQKLKQVKQEYAHRLAVKTQLVKAQQAARTARLLYRQLQQEGVGGPRTLKAQQAGIVSAIETKEGKQVPGGSPLITLAVKHQIEVTLGVNPEDVSKLHIGQPVQIDPVHANPGQPVTGKIRMIAQAVDPKTQLIAVHVSLPSEAAIPLGSYVQGTLGIASDVGLVAPRSAVLPDGKGFEVFTVDHGKAHKHHVRLGIMTDKAAEVIAGSLQEGDRIVTSGNYELKDGMQVSVQGSP